MTATMRAIARKRTCPQCLRQNSLSKANVGGDGTLWRTCRYCGTKAWATE